MTTFSMFGDHKSLAHWKFKYKKMFLKIFKNLTENFKMKSVNFQIQKTDKKQLVHVTKY